MKTNRQTQEAKSREQGIRRVTLAGSAVNVALVAVQLLAGWMAGSAAMIADAVHSLSDLVTDIVVLLVVHLSAGRTDCHRPGAVRSAAAQARVAGLRGCAALAGGQRGAVPLHPAARQTTEKWSRDSECLASQE